MELTDRPGAVVNRVLGSLMRSLGAAQANFVQKLLSDPQPEPEDGEQG
jgi:hypothetical protein